MSLSPIVFVSTENAPKAVGPYSQAVSAGGFLFVSGQLPIDPFTNEDKKEIYAATTLCLNNILAILKSKGLDKERVVKVTVLLKNMDTFPEMNRAYQDFFGDHRPARAAFEVSRLPKDAIVEIEAIACL